MNSNEIKQSFLTCHNPKCRQTWIPRMSTLPKACPACKNRHWNDPSYFKPKYVKQQETPETDRMN